MPNHHHYALPVGHLLHQNYRIQRVLGSGAFGITYLVQHLHLNPSFVIKEYLPEFAIRQAEQVLPLHSDKAALFNWGLENFFEEAKLLNNLEHPNIIKVSDLFTENGTAYFVMPYVGGQTLLEWIGSHSTPTVADLSAIALPLLDGLQYIHERGLLHRDIKPANILLAADGKPILIDFGSARFHVNQHKPMTKLYTPNFAPIEQLSQPSHEYTAALDIYSLSGCLYQMITGELPHDAHQRLLQDTQTKLSQNPSYLRLYPAYWLEAIDKGLSVNAADRFQAASEMKAALQPPKLATDSLKNTSPPTHFLHQTQTTNQTTDSPPRKKTTPPPKAPKATPPSSSKAKKGCMGVLMSLVVGMGMLVGAGLGLSKLWAHFKQPPVDKPYRGTIEFTLGKNQATFTGWLKNGMAEDNTSTGVLKLSDGTTCTISMSNNQRHGEGKCVYPKGSQYEGAWKNDVRFGYGKLTLPESSPILSYEGGFVNNKLSGKGTMKYRNGAVFVGEFANDDIKNNGKGEITGMMGMGSRCVGTFSRTKAKCQFKQGKSIVQYEGGHANGLWSGKGEIVTIDNGEETTRYQAQFKNGDVVGEMTSKSSKKTSQAQTHQDNNPDNPPHQPIISDETEDKPSPTPSPTAKDVDNLF